MGGRAGSRCCGSLPWLPTTIYSLTDDQLEAIALSVDEPRAGGGEHPGLARGAQGGGLGLRYVHPNDQFVVLSSHSVVRHWRHSWFAAPRRCAPQMVAAPPTRKGASPLFFRPDFCG